jgi:hypothetical protein
MPTNMDKLLQKTGKELVNHVFSDEWDETQPNLGEILAHADIALFRCAVEDHARRAHYRSIIEEIERAIFNLNLDQD